MTERISALPETDIDALAFSHMMIKLCNCLNCDLSSYKAALGCSACSQRTISALQDSDQKMLRCFSRSREEMLAYLEQKGLLSQAA
ncbi:MAG: hypothetical protein ACE5H9_12990 [Anaerolineae bacterium]